MEFFVTCGSGLETFALLELKEVLDIIPTEPQSHPGKIFFKTVSSSTTLADSDIITQLIKNLKTVERLFGVISSTGKDATRVYQSGHELLNNLFKLSSGSEVKEKLEKWKLARANLTLSDSAEGKHSPPFKRLRPSVGFRVNVKLSGAARRVCDARRIAKSVGSAIVKSAGSENWEIELRRGQAEVELSVYVTDDGIILAVPLTLKPISERSYLTHIPLRSTVASAMGSLLLRHLDELEPGGGGEERGPWLAMDPMCGTATILVELAVTFKFKFLDLMGMDVSVEQLGRARENILKANVGPRLSLSVGDARRRWPLKREVELDGIVCDLPFGLQHGNTEAEVKRNLPAILQSMHGALRSGGILVLLFSAALSPHLKELAQAESSLNWKLLATFPLKLGELHGNIFVFQK